MRLLRVLAAVLILHVPAARPAAAAQSTVPPSTAAEFLAAYNSQSASALKAFFTAHMSAGALQEQPADSLAQQFLDLRAQSGKIRLGEGWPAAPADDLEGTVRPEHGHAAKLVLLASSRQAGKLSDVFLIPQTDPSSAYALPSHAVAPGEIAAELGRYLESLAADGLFSGSVVVSHGGAPVFSHAYNLADRAAMLPNTPKTRFHIASMGKMFTAVAIAQLVEQGRLRFDETLAEALPTYPNHAAAQKITIDDLLAHRSGLGDVFDPQNAQAQGPWKTPGDLLPLFVNKPLDFEPGTAFGYSNAGYVVLGAVIEHASGTSFTSYLQKHVFDRAGIHDVLYSSAGGTATGYSYADDPFRLHPPVSNAEFLKKVGSANMPAYPAGGEYLTASDIDRFFNALQQGRLVAPATLARLTQSVTASAGGSDRGYARGFEIYRLAGAEIPGHNGGGMGAGIDSTGGWYRGWNVVVLTNGDPPAGMQAFERIWGFLLAQGS